MREWQRLDFLPKRSLVRKASATVIMTKGKTASARQRPPSKKRRASAALWNTDDEDEDEGGGVVELPRSAYEQERMLHIRSNQETLVAG